MKKFLLLVLLLMSTIVFFAVSCSNGGSSGSSSGTTNYNPSSPAIISADWDNDPSKASTLIDIRHLDYTYPIVSLEIINNQNLKLELIDYIGKGNDVKAELVGNVITFSLKDPLDTTFKGDSILFTIKINDNEIQTLKHYLRFNSKELPFIINDVDDLKRMHANLGKHFKLGNDITLVEDWEPLGDLLSPFIGTLDGANKTIENVAFATSEDFKSYGFFGAIGFEDDAEVKPEIKDLTIKMSNTDKFYNSNSVGVLAGRLHNTTVSNVSVDTTAFLEGIERVGGLAGDIFNSKILNSKSKGKIKGDSCVGGLIGWMEDSEVIDSESEAEVNAISNIAANTGYPSERNGGLVGWMLSSKIINSHAKGNVITESSYVGGLVGDAGKSEISGSSASGKVVAGSKSWYVGGLVGILWTNSSVTNSYANGDVHAFNTVGGLVGRVQELSTVSKSYAKGHVEGEVTIGGLVGYLNNNSVISESFASGSVKATESRAGGLAGGVFESKIIDSYSNSFVEGNLHVGGLIGVIDDYDVSNSKVTNSYASGNIVGMQYAAGVIGVAWNGSEVTNCVGLNKKVTAPFVSKVISYNSGLVENNYGLAEMELDGANYSFGVLYYNGESISASQLNKAFFTNIGWSEKVWDFSFDNRNYKYPILKGLPADKQPH